MPKFLQERKEEGWHVICPTLRIFKIVDILSILAMRCMVVRVVQWQVSVMASLIFICDEYENLNVLLHRWRILERVCYCFSFIHTPFIKKVSCVSNVYLLLESIHSTVFQALAFVWWPFLERFAFKRWGKTLFLIGVVVHTVHVPICIISSFHVDDLLSR